MQAAAAKGPMKADRVSLMSHLCYFYYLFIKLIFHNMPVRVLCIVICSYRKLQLIFTVSC